MTTMHHEHWTLNDIAQLIVLAGQGNGDRKIGHIMNRTYWSVRSARQSRNIILTPRDGFTWTEEVIADLKTLWTDEKKSALMIAGIFSEKYGRPFTRNSIIGKVDRLEIGRPNHRAGGAGHHGPRLYGNYKPRQKRAKDTGQYLRLVWSSPHVSALVSFAELEDKHCRFPISNINGFGTMYCGATKQPPTSPRQRSSYCGFHHQVTHGNDAATPPRTHRVGAGAGSSTPERVNGVGSTLPGAA